MSEKWKALVDKDHYEQQAKDDKKRYQNEMKNYTPPARSGGKAILAIPVYNCTGTHPQVHKFGE